ncbi:uncharacterized protein J3D65DRAFT_678814 [Phyllosticta citribraziliensis]|uniref:Uncharacterized protein n=1 Tax=Phyllosticta citribraziliensis TaxID=989973 RepID=A0ABR1LF06_9PEZI
MSRDPSIASHSAYEQAPAQGPSQHQKRHPYCETYSTVMDPTPSATGGFCPPGYRPAQPYRPLAMRPHTSETPVVQENQLFQAQPNLREPQVMLSQTLASETTASFGFGPYDDFIHQSILSEKPMHLEHPVHVKQTVREEQLEHAEHTNPTQSQEIYDDSPATIEALKAVDSKVDELLDLIAAHQNNGTNGDSLRARVRQRLRNLGQMTQVGADSSLPWATKQQRELT